MNTAIYTDTTKLGDETPSKYMNNTIKLQPYIQYIHEVRLKWIYTVWDDVAKTVKSQSRVEGHIYKLTPASTEATVDKPLNFHKDYQV